LKYQKGGVTIKNFVEGDDIPLGLGMALAQNMDALNHFASLPESERKKIIDRTHQIQSKQEMSAFVQQIAEGNYN
jgi:hypothetical protein